MNVCPDLEILLLAVALQVGAINESEALDAANFCRQHPDGNAADYLLQQKKVDQEQRRALATLLKTHLRRSEEPLHDLAQADARVARLVAAYRRRDQLVADLSLVDQALEKTAMVESSSNASSSSYRSSGAETGTQSQPGTNRFRILRFHDEGGLGQVFQAQDTELNRTVALKEIQERYVQDRISRDRFFREAQITGGLEHPGIVPVYGMGYHEDGRPYYAMRLIRGKSFRGVIREFHDANQNTNKFADRAIELRRLLARFVDACQAIGYAHRRGVIHRDIKPDNIMVGRYGETLVVDWGLAKRIDTPEESVDPTIPAEEPLELPDGDYLQTQSGRAMGSPHYMSPEQARGDVALLGPATDVYSLGATLFVLLTNTTAATGPTAKEVVRKVAEGRIRTPREVNPQVPLPLDAICQQAMRLTPESRYATTTELTEDIERFLADEPVSACRETFTERAFRYARKHRQQVLAAVAGLIVLSVVSVAWAVVTKTRQSAEVAEEQRVAMFDFVEELTSKVPERAGEQGTFLNYLQTVEREIADRMLSDVNADEYDPAIHAAILEFLSAAYLKQVGIETEMIGFLRRHLPMLEENLQVTSVMDHLAYALKKVGRTSEAVEIYERVVAIRNRLDPNDERLLRAKNSLASAYQEAGRFHQAIQIYSSIRERRSSRGAQNLALAYLEAEEYPEAIQWFTAALQMRQEENPRSKESIASMNGLAKATRESGRVAEALKIHEDALSLSCELDGADHRTTWIVVRDATETYLAAGRVQRAFELAVSHDREQLQSFPDPAHYKRDMATALLAKASLAAGRIDEGLRLFTELSDRLEPLGPENTRYLLAVRQLATAQLHANRPDEAVLTLSRSRPHIESFYGLGHPYHLDLLLTLGTALTRLNRWDEAVQSHEQAIELAAARGASFVGPNGAASDELRNLVAMADCLLVQGKLDEATAVAQQLLVRLQTEGHPHFGYAARSVLAGVRIARGDLAGIKKELEEITQGLRDSTVNVPARLRYPPSMHEARLALLIAAETN